MESLGRAPEGRKGYQGRVERSHRTDDEKFYIPLLSSINSERKLLRMQQRDILVQRKKASFWQRNGW